MFDQVLLRPSLLPYYPDGGARILTRLGTVSLADDRGRPDPEVGSDHFPVVLRLTL